MLLSLRKNGLTSLLKEVRVLKVILSNYLGGCSYSFQGSSELNSMTVTFSLFF